MAAALCCSVHRLVEQKPLLDIEANISLSRSVIGIILIIIIIIYSCLLP